jgi:biotin carboxylase
MAVWSESELRTALSAVTAGQTLVEGFIPDPSTPRTGPGSAPYASVELLISKGTASVLGATGRAPLAPPFRETGFYFPADVAPETEAELRDAAIAAAHALGIEQGALHVEIKCTDTGPVTIEVNGRPGGHAVSPLLKRGLGIDTLRLAMRVAVGEHVVYDETPETDEVVFRFDVQPHAGLRHITSVDGLEQVQAIPGVEQVMRGTAAGDDYSWKDGTLGYVAAVLGAAPDHNAAYRIRDEVLAQIAIEGTP